MDMANIDRVPREIYSLHQRTPKAIERAMFKPVASYDQMFAFLIKFRSMLAAPSVDSMNYIFANQEPLHEILTFMKRLSEGSILAVVACNEAQRRSEDVARKFQQAWDLVDIKADAIATQSRYVITISQEMGEIWRTHTSPPNKHWRMLCLSLAFELKEAIQTRQQMRWGLQDAEKRAERWEGRYIRAVEKWRNTYQDAMQLQGAFTAIRTEFLAGQSLAKVFVGQMREVRDQINDAAERDRVRRINQALSLEEERETEEYGAMSRFKKRFRGR